MLVMYSTWALKYRDAEREDEEQTVVRDRELAHWDLQSALRGKMFAESLCFEDCELRAGS